MKYLPIFLIGLPMISYADDSRRLSTDFHQFQQQIKIQNEQLQQAQQQRWINQHQYRTPENSAQQSGLSETCLPYSRIHYFGMHKIDLTPIALKPSECISEQRLNKLIRDITASYLEAGYIPPTLNFQDGQSGILKFYGTEGKVTKLSSNSKRLNFTTFLPNILGKVLNIKDLDQALDQANKMASSNVTVDVLPINNGEIELAFVNDEKSPITGFISVDNFASKRTERWQAKAGLNVDNPFGLSDTLYIGTGHTLKSLSKNFNRSLSLYQTLPYGYWTFSNFVSFSQFKSDIPLQQLTAEQKGHTWQASFRTDYTFDRGQNSISSLYGQLERIKSKSYFQDNLITLQSPTLTTLQGGINHLQLLPNGSLIADLNYERGLKWWNATPNQGRDQPEGQYNRWQGSLNFDYYYALQSHLLHQSSRLTGQYSKNYLPAIKQADLLGRYAVRGFNDFSLSAEKSLVLQNSLGKILQYNEWKFEPYLLVDLGIQKASADDATSEKALSYGIGIKASHSKNWHAQTEWVTGRVFQPKNITQERSINFNLHFSVF